MVYHVESYLSLGVILQNLTAVIHHAILMYFWVPKSYLSPVVILQNLTAVKYHAILMYFGSQKFGDASYSCGTTVDRNNMPHS